MRTRANDEKFEFWPFLLLAALVLLVGSLIGPALDAHFAFHDAQIEAHKTDVVLK